MITKYHSDYIHAQDIKTKTLGNIVSDIQKIELSWMELYPIQICYMMAKLGFNVSESFYIYHNLFL